MSDHQPALHPLDRLKHGLRRFRTEIYRPNAEAYQLAGSTPQKPHTLVITCADSRIDPEALTQSGPGEIFVTRNIGNMVPAYGEMLGGVSAVIEYAVSALKVQHVVICGHSDCGAMKGLLHPEAVEALPTVKNWLTNGKAALSVAETLQPVDPQHRDLLPVLTEQNVLMQLAHLKTHPAVAGGMARGELSVSGWIYDIANGEVRIAEDGSARFHTVSEAEAEADLLADPALAHAGQAAPRGDTSREGNE